MESLPSWEAWIEVGPKGEQGIQCSPSLPSWEAWIEVSRERNYLEKGGVASLMGSVD